MLVRQLVGRKAGEIVDMPYHVAQRCLAAKTAQLHDAPYDPKPKKAKRASRPDAAAAE